MMAARKSLPIAGAYVPSSYKASRYNHIVQQPDGAHLAFNGVSNAMARLDGESWARYQQLAAGARIDPKSETDRRLVEGKFLVPKESDESAYLRSRHMQSRYDSTSWALTICPTIACNFGCDYCFEVHHPGKMGAEVQAALMRMLEQRLSRIRDYSVMWYGGEPTIAWDVVQELSRKFIRTCNKHEVGYSANMVSNGFLLDERKIAELPKLRIGHVQVTLDGDAPQHDARRKLLSGKGTFERIVGNLQHFVGAPTSLSIRVNVDGRNRDGVHALIDRLAAVGLAGQPNIEIYFAAVNSSTEPTMKVLGFCMTRKDFAEEEPEYYDHAHRVGLASIPYPGRGGGSCIAVRPEQYVVQSDGELHKCWDTVGQSQFAVGHLLDPSSNPLESSQYQRWMSWEPFDPALGCSSCTWLASCMGGCPLKAVYPELSPDGQVHLECTTFKYNAEKMLPRFAEYVAAGGRTVADHACDG